MLHKFLMTQKKGRVGGRGRSKQNEQTQKKLVSINKTRKKREPMRERQKGKESRKNPPGQAPVIGPRRTTVSGKRRGPRQGQENTTLSTIPATATEEKNCLSY